MKKCWKEFKIGSCNIERNIYQYTKAQIPGLVLFSFSIKQSVLNYTIVAFIHFDLFLIHFSQHWKKYLTEINKFQSLLARIEVASSGAVQIPDLD